MSMKFGTAAATAAALAGVKVPESVDNVFRFLGLVGTFEQNGIYTLQHRVFLSLQILVEKLYVSKN